MDSLLAPVVLDEARELVWRRDDPASREFAEAVALLITGVEAGYVCYAGAIAEALAFDGPIRDPAKAYIYYYVSYAQEGSVMQFCNTSQDPSHYQGPLGDFRNEGMVAGLVEELGVHRLHALDQIASNLVANEI